MDAERARAFLLTLPHVVETMQWGENQVFWVGDKVIGGKMFALVNLDEPASHGVISFVAGRDRYSELLEVEGFRPAPYFARIFWIAVERWDVFRQTVWESELSAAHAITLSKLPPKVRKTLALPAKELQRMITQARKERDLKSRSSGTAEQTPHPPVPTKHPKRVAR